RKSLQSGRHFVLAKRQNQTAISASGIGDHCQRIVRLSVAQRHGDTGKGGSGGIGDDAFDDAGGRLRLSEKAAWNDEEEKDEDEDRTTHHVSFQMQWTISVRISECATDEEELHTLGLECIGLV